MELSITSRKGGAKVNPIRKPTTEGTAKQYNFDVIGTRFLVKNLSGGDVLVGFESDLEGEDTETWLIPDGAWQVIPGAENRIHRTTVYVRAYAHLLQTEGLKLKPLNTIFQGCETYV